MSAETPLSFAKPFLIAGGKSRPGGPMNVYGAIVSIKIANRDSGGNLTLIEDLAEPKGGPPLHVHHREDEGFFVLEGDYVFEVDGRSIEAHAGDFVWGPRNVPHTYQNIGASKGRLLITVTPGGIENFFRELAAIPGPPDPVAVAPLFARYGIELLGPPLSARK